MTLCFDLRAIYWILKVLPIYGFKFGVTSLLQMDKTWSAQASRPYDPYLTPKGEEQVRTQGLSPASVQQLLCVASI